MISFHTISFSKQIPVIFSKTLRSTSAFLGRYIHFHNTEITAHIQAETCRFFFIIRKEAFSHFLRHAEGFFAVKPPSNDFLISLCVFFSKSLMSIPYIHFKVNTLPKIILAPRFGIIAAGRVNWTPSHNSFSFFIAEVLVETNNSRHFNLGNTTLLECWILQNKPVYHLFPLSFLWYLSDNSSTEIEAISGHNISCFGVL